MQRFLKLKGRSMVYLDNYISKDLFDEKLKEFIKGSFLDALKKCSQKPDDCKDIDIFVSAGTPEHWKDSIEFALRNGGYTIWGKREENKDEWINRILSQGLKGMESTFFESYIRSGSKLGKIQGFTLSPITINVFYCSNVGLFGAGIVTTLIIDGMNPFWTEERNASTKIGFPVVIFPFRWLVKIFWLHSSVLANRTDPGKWRGIEPPQRVVVRGGIQSIKDLSLRHELVKRLINDIVKGVDETLMFFEKFSSETKIVEERVVKPEGKILSPPLLVPGKCIIEVSSEELSRIRNEILQEFAVEPDIIDFLLSVLVYGCKNVLLVGKPGTGKTSIARFIAEKLGFEPIVVTANAHWSRVDVIGGPMFIGSGSVTWRPGVLMEAIARHLEAKQHGKKGAWLIIDEINRADVDKAFGEFFTIFSGPEPSEWVIPSYIIDEWKKYSNANQNDVYRPMLEAIKRNLYRNEKYIVPPDFRVIGTMNYVDVANLFAIGEAFTRRFVRIEVEYPNDIDKEINILLNKIKRGGDFREAIRILEDEDVEKLIKSVTKSLRDEVKRLSFGSAYLLNTLYTFLAQVRLKLDTGTLLENIKNEVRKLLKYSIESTLSLTPLWDEELRREVEKVLNEALGLHE
jgi:MoxR-like ATPase